MDMQRIQKFIDVKRQWSGDTMTVLGNAEQGKVEITLDDLQGLVDAAQKKDQLEARVAELARELAAHQALEGAPVEMRTARGSWADVVDYVSPMVSLF